jgi:hypothetical protein
MICLQCPEEQRMKCRYTASLGKKTRYRVYRCPKCKLHFETYEAPIEFLPPTQEEVRAIQKAITHVKAARFRFTRRAKEGGAPTPMGAPFGLSRPGELG